MALVSARTLVIPGNDATTQNYFTIENGIASRVDVYVRKLAMEMDSIAVLTALMPLVKVSRATSISGGVLLDKSLFDTTMSSDSAVNCRAQNNETAPITATEGNIIWQQFAPRMHTAVEQQYVIEQDLLPSLVKTQDFILKPGQSLLVKKTAAAGTSNAINTAMHTIFAAWEEVAIATFSISGEVTLSGSPVSGAKVMVLEADDISMTNAILREVITTGAGGTWASTIRTGKVGAAFVQYENGGTYYTANGSPYLEQ
jgi:hypothetical protein